MHKFSLKLIPALVLAAISGAASASGFQLTEQNASGIGNAYAGSAAVGENASTIYFNPAAMTRLQAREISGGISAVNLRAHFNDQGSSVGTLNGTGEGGDAGGWGVIPNLYASWALNKDLYLGLGIGAPFGFKIEYDDLWLGAAHSQMFDVKTLNINPSVAWRAHEKLSLGFGLNWQRGKMKYDRLAGVGAGGFENVKAKVDLDDDAWGWNVGLLYEPSPTMRIGLSYRSEVKYHMTGDVSLQSDGSAAGNALLAGLVGAGYQSKRKSTVSLPGTFIISVAQQLSDRWEMLGDISRTGWSSINNFDIDHSSGLRDGQRAQRIDADFRDAWRIAFGANYKYNDQWKLKYGIAYDQTPVKRSSTRMTQLPDNDRVWLSFGTQWTPNKASRLDLGLAYVFIRDARINKTITTVPHGYNGGTVSGKYEGNLWVLGAQYSQSF